MALLKGNNLCLGYDNRVVVRDLNFEVHPGEYLCIVGENGSGKTTLMKTLLGIRKPISGTIERGEGLKANEIGYLPQQTSIQKDFPASVHEVVISGCQGHLGKRPFYGKKEKEAVRKNLERMGIADLENRCYAELSGGQQQRVLLARALCATNRVLILDEPVAGLDPSATADMYRLIRDLNREGITVLMVSHDLEAAFQYATHILHIGKHMFFGTREEYLQHLAEDSANGGEDA